MYKRYIKKDGRLVGPYYYKSVRQADGSIKSVYVGKANPAKNVTLLSFLMLGAILAFILIFAFRNQITGFITNEFNLEKNNLTLEQDNLTLNLQNTSNLSFIEKTEKKKESNEIITEEKKKALKAELKSFGIREEVANEVAEKGKVKVIIELEDNTEGIKTKQNKATSTLSEDENSKLLKYATLNAISGEVNADTLKKLTANSAVKRIYIPRTAEILLSDSVPLINATAVWPKQISGINITGKDQTVCIVDTGVDSSHSALSGQIVAQYCYCSISGSPGCCPNGQTIDSNATDDHGHGTHVAGIVASTDATYRGVAPEVKIVMIKACNATGSCSENDFSAGIDWCIANATKYNISVISLSLGGGCYQTSASCDGFLAANAISNAVAKNITVTLASGNSGQTNCISYPACSTNATSVGATTKTDAMASYTNRASILDLLAPGGLSSAQIISAQPGGSFVGRYGTSMATPHVAGVVALMQQYNKLQSNRMFTANEIERLLKRTGKAIYDSGTGLNFSRVNALEAIERILKINDAEISVEKPGKGKVAFNSATDLGNASEAFIIGNNSVFLNATEFPQYNKTANLTFYSLWFEKTPIVLKDGAVCTSPQCSIISYAGGNFSFAVLSFSNYTSGVNSNLTVWDETDSGMPFYEGNAGLNEDVFFFANYTNRTSGEAISNANCSITINSTTSDMKWNATKNIFEFNRTFFTTGSYSYNITCSHAAFENLSAVDSITVSECELPAAGTDWIIINLSITCDNKNLFFQNQSLILNNATLILRNNSAFILIQASINYSINISSNSNFTLYNSVIRSNVTSYFDLYLEGYGSHFNATLNKSRLYVSGNKNHVIENSTFNNEVYLQNSSVSNIKNSIINSLYIQNNAIVNFTVKSNITTLLQTQDIPKIFGYVKMPSSSSVTSGNVTRNFPINLNYTNGVAASGRQVNITDKNGTLAWQGITDSQGYAEANLTFNSSNYAPGNFTISVNVSQDISLATETPVNFTLTDTTAPIITLVSPANNSYRNNLSQTFSCNATDNSGLANITSYIFNVTSTLLSNTTIVSGIFNSTSWNYTFSADGNYNWSCSATDVSGNSAFANNFTLIIDRTSPIWSNQTASAPSTWNSTTLSYFNITWQDSNLDKIFIEGNWSGSAKNYSMYSLGSGIYGYNATLPAGTFYWRSYANDTAGNLNTSTTSTFTISKASSSVNLLLGGEDNDKSINTGTSLNISASLITPATGSIIIYEDGSAIASGSSAASIVKSYTIADTYNLTAYYAATQNYSAYSKTHLLMVSSPSTSTTQTTTTTTSTTTTSTTSTCTESWTCTSFSACINETQTRTCSDINACGTTARKPALSKNCVASIPCNENWSCTEWSLCRNNTKFRICNDLNNCGTTANKSNETIVCSPEEAGAGAEKPGMKVSNIISSVTKSISERFSAVFGQKIIKEFSIEKIPLIGFAWLKDLFKFLGSSLASLSSHLTNLFTSLVSLNIHHT